jgi:hypothetical protein
MTAKKPVFVYFIFRIAALFSLTLNEVQAVSLTSPTPMSVIGVATVAALLVVECFEAWEVLRQWTRKSTERRR